jgi:hypothetical protein
LLRQAYRPVLEHPHTGSGHDGWLAI